MGPDTETTINVMRHLEDENERLKRLLQEAYDKVTNHTTEQEWTDWKRRVEEE